RLLQRMALARRRLTRITPGPLLIRAAVLVTALLAQVLAWPGSLLLSRVFGLLALVALAAALSPRRFGPTVAVLAAAAGWLLDTGWYDQRIVLWRLLGLATLLYL